MSARDDTCGSGGCLERIVGILRRTHASLAGEHLDAETKLLGGGRALDSVALLEFVLALEQEFDCEIEESELSGERFATVGCVAGLIGAKVPASGAQR